MDGVVSDGLGLTPWGLHPEFLCVKEEKKSDTFL